MSRDCSSPRGVWWKRIVLHWFRDVPVITDLCFGDNISLCMSVPLATCVEERFQTFDLEVCNERILRMGYIRRPAACRPAPISRTSFGLNADLKMSSRQTLPGFWSFAHFCVLVLPARLGTFLSLCFRSL